MGVPHSYAAASEETPWTIYWIHFKGDLAGFFAESCPTQNAPQCEFTDQRPQRSLRDIFRTLSMGYSQENLICTTTEFSFPGIIALPAVLSQCVIIDRGGIRYRDSSRHYMVENIEKKLSLSDITEHIGYSTSISR